MLRLVHRVFFAQTVWLTIIGLWDLFAVGLPPLEKGNLFSIFPVIFPTFLGAVYLFLLPLIPQQPRFWLWISLVLNLLLCMAAMRLCLGADTGKMLRMSLLVLGVIGFSVVYVLFLFKKRQESS